MWKYFYEFNKETDARVVNGNCLYIDLKGVYFKGC